LLCALCGVSASEVGGGSAGLGGGSGCSVRIIGGGYFFPCEELGGIVLEEDGVIREITSWSALLLNKHAHLLPSKINAFFALPNWSNFAEDISRDDRVRTSLLTCLIASGFSGKGVQRHNALLKGLIIDILKAFEGNALRRVVNACAEDADSPLVLAILHRRTAIAVVLVENGANLSDVVVCRRKYRWFEVRHKTIPQLLEIEAIKKALMKDDIVAYNYLRSCFGLKEISIDMTTADDDREAEDGYVDVVTVSDSEDDGAAGAGGGSAGPGGGDGGDSRKKLRVK